MLAEREHIVIHKGIRSPRYFPVSILKKSGSLPLSSTRGLGPLDTGPEIEQRFQRTKKRNARANRDGPRARTQLCETQRRLATDTRSVRK